MIKEIKVPEIGESVTQGILTQWMKLNGQIVTEGEDLFELETDKATMAIPSPAGGKLEIRKQEGDEVSPGDVVAVIDTSQKAEESDSQSESVLETYAKKPEKALSKQSPAVERILKETSIDPDSVQGSGKDGRLTKGDLLKKQDSLETGETKKLPEDKRFTETPGERQTRVPMTALRKSIARHLVKARQEAAHLTTFNEINMNAVMTVRSTYKQQFWDKHNTKLGFMSFYVKAVSTALKEFPEINSYIEGDELIYNHFYDIGVAVSTDRGLLVPVLRDADKLSFAEIESSIANLAQKARDKKISLKEMEGGSFTITNGGIFGSLLSTPIPNYPQSAILGMHTIQKRPVVINDEIKIQPMMYVALTYDHRVVDGSGAVSFLGRIKEMIEAPEKMLLEI